MLFYSKSIFIIFNSIRVLNNSFNFHEVSDRTLTSISEKLEGLDIDDIPDFDVKETVYSHSSLIFVLLIVDLTVM